MTDLRYLSSDRKLQKIARTFNRERGTSVVVMLWVLLAAAGACANAAFFICNKRFLEKIDPYHLAACNFFGASVFLFVFSVYKGIPAIGDQFVPAVIATTLINIVTTILLFRALRSSDISLAVPMLSFTPIFLVGTAALLLHEYPSPAGIVGILVIMLGSYVINASEEHTRLIDPIMALIRNRGAIAMIGLAFLWAVTINFDKLMVQNSDATFGSGILYLLLAITFTLVSLGRWRRSRLQVAAGDAGRGTSTGVPGILRTLQPLVIPAMVIGLLSTIEETVINMAYLLQIVPYVIAIKRMSILVVVFYGIVVINEQEILYRFAGAVLMVIGATTIILFH